MSLEEIRKTIEKESKAESDKIKEAAAAEADRIISEARAKASEIAKNAKSDASKEAERIMKERISGAEIEANYAVLRAKESVLERGVSMAKKAAASQISKKWTRTVVSNIAKEFSKFADKKDIVIRSDKKNEHILKGLGFDLVQSHDELTLATRDGKISIDASAESLVDRKEAYARALLSEKLWKGKSKT